MFENWNKSKGINRSLPESELLSSTKIEKCQTHNKIIKNGRERS